MSRRSLTALAVAAVLATAGFLVESPTAAEAQCLNRTACSELKAEIAKLQPDLKAARQQLRRVRRALRAAEPGSEQWLAKRTQLRRLKKSFRSLRRELKALQRDSRHQACSSC